MAGAKPRYVFVLEESVRYRMPETGKLHTELKRYKVCHSESCAYRWAMMWASTAKEIMGGEIFNNSSRMVTVRIRPDAAYRLIYEIVETQVEQGN